MLKQQGIHWILERITKERENTHLERLAWSHQWWIALQRLRFGFESPSPERPCRKWGHNRVVSLFGVPLSSLFRGHYFSANERRARNKTSIKTLSKPKVPTEYYRMQFYHRILVQLLVMLGCVPIGTMRKKSFQNCPEILNVLQLLMNLQPNIVIKQKNVTIALPFGGGTFKER